MKTMKTKQINIINLYFFLLKNSRISQEKMKKGKKIKLLLNKNPHILMRDDYKTIQ